MGGPSSLYTYSGHLHRLYIRRAEYSPSMAQDWLLIETLGTEPTVVAVGRQPKKMVPLPVFLPRNRYLSTITDVLRSTVEEKTPVRFTIAGTDRIVITHPLILPTGDVHGAQLWFGDSSSPPPQRPIAGAWAWNIVTNAVTLDEGCLYVNGITKRSPGEVQSIAESFQNIEPNPDEADALAKLVTARPGEWHSATWDGKGDDGEARRVHFSARICADPVTSESIVRGVNINVGGVGPARPEQRPVILEQRILAAVAEPGTYRALVNLRTLRLLKWIGEPMPELSWEFDPTGEPQLHPDDLDTAKEMARGLRTSSSGAVLKTEADLRLRSRDGGWISVHITAHLTLLDENTTAALVILRRVGDSVSTI